MAAKSQNSKAQDPGLRSLIDRVSAIDLIASIRTIREARDMLTRMLAEAEKELSGRTAPIAPSPASARATAASRTRREAVARPGEPDKLIEGSAASWAADAIRQAGRPLTGPELIEVIEQRGHKVKVNTLAGSLYRWVKAKKVFYLAKPNTFGLLEMKK